MTHHSPRNPTEKHQSKPCHSCRWFESVSGHSLVKEGVVAPNAPSAQTWVVGEPYIYEHDRPDMMMVVVCTSIIGTARYLFIKDNRRWAHELQLYKHSIPLTTYGIHLSLSEDGTVLISNKVSESKALYRDGEPQKWQAADSQRFSITSPRPKKLRFDPKVLPKLLKWIKRPVKLEPWGFKLWQHLHQNHGLILCESELQEIVRLACALGEDEKPWIPWAGGDCPVTQTAIVEIKLRNGYADIDVAARYFWGWSTSALAGDIVAYRVLKQERRA